MAGPLTAVDRLAEVFTTTNQRLAVTVAALGLLAVVVLSSQTVQRRLNERTRPLYADVATTVLLVGTFLLSISVTLGVWGQTSELRNLYVDHDLGGEFVAKLVVSGVVLLSTYIVVRFVRRLLRELLGSSSAVTDHQREITHRIVQVTIWTAAAVVVLGIWFDDLSGLLVGAGFLGIVLGMAARQTLGAMLAGFVLMFSRPFEIGDWIAIEDEEGIVTDISIVNTRIRTFDGEYVVVPNDVVNSNLVTNRSRRGRLRIEVEVGVDYETDVERASELAAAAIADLDEVLSVPEPQTVAKAFGDSAVLLGVRFWIDKPSARRHWAAKTAAIRAIKESFEAEGIEIPYPQRELSGRAERGGLEAADGRSAGVRTNDGDETSGRNATVDTAAGPSRED